MPPRFISAKVSARGGLLWVLVIQEVSQVHVESGAATTLGMHSIDVLCKEDGLDHKVSAAYLHGMFRLYM